MCVFVSVCVCVCVCELIRTSNYPKLWLRLWLKGGWTGFWGATIADCQCQRCHAWQMYVDTPDKGRAGRACVCARVCVCVRMRACVCVCVEGVSLCPMQEKWRSAAGGSGIVPRHQQLPAAPAALAITTTSELSKSQQPLLQRLQSSLLMEGRLCSLSHHLHNKTVMMVEQPIKSFCGWATGAMLSSSRDCSVKAFAHWVRFFVRNWCTF